MAFLVLVVYPFVDMGYSFTDQFHGWDVLDKSGVPKAEAVYWELSQTEDLVGEPMYWEAETKVHELGIPHVLCPEYGDLEDDLSGGGHYDLSDAHRGIGPAAGGEVQGRFASRAAGNRLCSTPLTDWTSSGGAGRLNRKPGLWT